MDRFLRTAAILGEQAMEKLKNSRVAVFGIGGVGGYVLEALVRSGVGSVDIIDGDTVNITNLNRQIIATDKTVGLSKTKAAKERCFLINPQLNVKTFDLYFGDETAQLFNFADYDYVADAIDDVNAKVLIAKMCQEAKTPLISSMGFGNKLEPTKIEVSDIYKTSVCPLARVMRRRLKDAGIKKLKVVYSKEEPKLGLNQDGTRVLASTAFVPSAAGLVIASEIVKDLTKNSTDC